MARISFVGSEARERLQRVGKGYQERAPYREAITGLGDNELLELEPEGQESLRQLKLLARRAANETGREIQYGETEQGSLLVWIAEPRAQRRRRRQPDGGT